MKVPPSHSETSQHDKAPRKTYRSPELRRYGSIRELTLGLGMDTANDGQGPMGAGFKSLP